jgi:hypothetical protein
MMRKNVDQAHIDTYLDLLNLRFDIGRADIAQNLHSMGENIEIDQHTSTSALLSEDLMPLRRCGSTDREARANTCESDTERSSRTLPTRESDTDMHRSRTLHTVFASHPSKPAGVVSAAGSVPVNELNRLHFENCRMPRTLKEKAEERHIDSWAKEGQDGRWTRVHRSGRRALFTPFKVAGGPSAKTSLKKIRITRGKFFASGKTFKIIDDWTTRANAHRLLQGSWIGTTDFREVAEYIDDDSDEEAIDITATTTTTTTTTTGPVVEDKETQDLHGGAEKAEAQDLRGGAEKQAENSSRRTEYFDLDLSPDKQKTTHPLEALARKLPGGPPARLSAQGRTGASHNLAPARTSSNRRDALAHVGGGVQEDVHFKTSSYTTSHAYGRQLQEGYAHRASATIHQGVAGKVSAGACSAL